MPPSPGSWTTRINILTELRRSRKPPTITLISTSKKRVYRNIHNFHPAELYSRFRDPGISVRFLSEPPTRLWSFPGYLPPPVLMPLQSPADPLYPSKEGGAERTNGTCPLRSRKSRNRGFFQKIYFCLHERIAISFGY